MAFTISFHKTPFSESVSNSAQQVGLFNIGLGWVLEKIPGSGSGWSKGVELYDRVISGIIFTLAYFWVFLGIYWYFWVYRISSLLKFG